MQNLNRLTRYAVAAFIFFAALFGFRAAFGQDAPGEGFTGEGLISPDELTLPEDPGFAVEYEPFGMPGAFGVSAEDAAALQEIFARMTPIGQLESGWFAPETDACSWHGISCDGGAVIGLNFDNVDFFCELPAAITALPSIQEIHFTNTLVHGIIPEELFVKDTLKVIDMSNNLLTGPIPSTVYLPNLETLNLANNKLTEEKQRDLSERPALAGCQAALSYPPERAIDLTPGLDGGIPGTIGGLGQLRRLDLSGNDLGGALPDELLYLYMLEAVYLNDNRSDDPFITYNPELIAKLEAIPERDLDGVYLMLSPTEEPTPEPLPTDTPVPLPTDTPVPLPTDTPVPLPTDTLVPLPTDTPVPLPTDTPVPLPTDTPVPLPTDTPVPTTPPIFVTATPVTIVLPTAIPPTAVPPTAVPPTAVPIVIHWVTATSAQSFTWFTATPSRQWMTATPGWHYVTATPMPYIPPSWSYPTAVPQYVYPTAAQGVGQPQPTYYYPAARTSAPASNWTPFAQVATATKAPTVNPASLFEFKYDAAQMTAEKLPVSWKYTGMDSYMINYLTKNRTLFPGFAMEWMTADKLCSGASCTFEILNIPSDLLKDGVFYIQLQGRDKSGRVYQSDPIGLQTAVTPEPSATPVVEEAKKGNWFTRFFRWLFGPIIRLFGGK